MNHLAATCRGSRLGLPMQMSAYLLKPAPIMSRENRDKDSSLYSRLTHTHTHTHAKRCLQGILSHMTERRKTACGKDVY